MFLKGELKRMSNENKPKAIRKALVTFLIILGYATFITTGIVIAKYQPIVMDRIDFIIIPISLCYVLFIYLFRATEEIRMELKIDKTTIEVASLYAEGLSFQEIAEKTGLNHVEKVKRHIVKFCKLRSA